jgi:hypothetical protein
MPEAHSIKGVVLELAVEGVKRMLEEGRISRDEVEARLDAQDLEILEQKLLPGMWYPIDSMQRILELVTRDERDRGGLEAMTAVGVSAAERLFASEVYKNFVATAENRGRRAGATLVGLAPLLCNFTRWSYDPGPEDGNEFTVEVRDAERFPDLLRFLAQGFIQYLGERVNDAPVRVESERPSPDCIVYRGLRGQEPGPGSPGEAAGA